MPQELATPPDTPPALYIAWTRYQRRPESMRRDLGYTLCFVPPLSLRAKTLKALLSYPIQAVRTIWLLLIFRPRILWLQVPPSMVVHIAWMARLLCGGGLYLIADLHNSALSQFWLSVPLTRRLLNSFDIVLLHNEPTRQAAIGKGIKPPNLLVLEDRLPRFTQQSDMREAVARPCFVVPCSFQTDEPVHNVLDAARRLPEFEFVITGDLGKAESLGYLEYAPVNVVFTGFLPTADYERLLMRATGILCLTTDDGIQLSAAAEAVAAGKPMIVSGTPLLRALFAAGLFVDNSADGIESACRAVAGDYDRFASATRDLRDDVEREKRWQAQAARILQLLPRRH